jgi:hypothetical protein
MEEKKRRAEGPLEDGLDEKRQRVEEEEEEAGRVGWLDWPAWERERQRVGKVLLDPDTWLPHIIDKNTRTVPSPRFPSPPLTYIFEDINRANEGNCWRVLSLACYHLGSLPAILFRCRLFETIYLHRADTVTVIPAEIGRWKGHSLYLAYSGISRLPPEIGDCQQLQSIDLFRSNIQELPRRLGKCPELTEVIIDLKATTDLERPRLWQFYGLNRREVATKLKLDWANYVTGLRCFVFCLESRICKETADGISGNIPCDILARIASFV